MRTGVRAEGPLEAIGLATGQVPEPVFEAYVALTMARTVLAGAGLGIFDALAERSDTAEDLAARLGLDPRGTDVLCVALRALGYLDAGADGVLRPTAKTERTLLPGATLSVRDWLRFTEDMWDTMGGVEDAVRSGDAQGLHDRAPDDPYWERYMRGLRDLARLSGADVARAIGARRPRRLLDLAGGHGGFAMALCDRHPGLTARIVELEGSARIGRQIVAEEGYADRIEHVAGDLFEAELGTGFDVATAHSIVHHLDPGAAVELLRRARAALRPGGRMAVFELERPAPGERGTQLGALTGLLFYVTSGARTYTAAELEGFFAAAGFARVRTKRLLRGPGSLLVLGDAPRHRSSWFIR
jgi:SAM-dependent methyltransferase